MMKVSTAFFLVMETIILIKIFKRIESIQPKLLRKLNAKSNYNKIKDRPRSEKNMKRRFT